MAARKWPESQYRRNERSRERLMKVPELLRDICPAGFGRFAFLRASLGCAEGTAAGRVRSTTSTTEKRKKKKREKRKEKKPDSSGIEGNRTESTGTGLGGGATRSGDQGTKRG